MTHTERTASLGLPWLVSAVALFWYAGSASPVAWAALAVVGVLPPLMFAALDSDGPPQTVAQVLYDAEKAR